MSEANSDEPAWCVAGAVQYVADDGPHQSERQILRNILAQDRETAAQRALELFKGLLEFRAGTRIQEIGWSQGPDVSGFDPFYDR
jgi:hypothetical protein